MKNTNIKKNKKKDNKKDNRKKDSTKLSKVNEEPAEDSKEVIMYYRIRNICGLLGVLLPWIALFSAGIATPHPSDQWWWSISATYYQTPALVGVLSPCALVLILYVSFEWKDNLVTTLSGLCGLGVVLFPCRVDWIPDGTEVGFFQLPIETSNLIHCACASFFFLLLAINSLKLFVKTTDVNNMSPQKVIRNKIYTFCGYAMLVVMGIFAVLCVTDAPGWTTMIVEIVLLHLFGITWLVKGRAFPFLNDPGERSYLF